MNSTEYQQPIITITSMTEDRMYFNLRPELQIRQPLRICYPIHIYSITYIFTVVSAMHFETYGCDAEQEELTVSTMVDILASELVPCMVQ
jgi:hypothetical protein